MRRSQWERCALSSPAAGADWQLEGRGRRAWSPARPPRDLRREIPEGVVTPQSCGSGCACFPPYPELGSQVGCACEQELIPLLLPRPVVHTCFIHGWRLRRGAWCASVLGPGKRGRASQVRGLQTRRVWTGAAVEPRGGAGPRQRKHARGALRILRTFVLEQRSPSAALRLRGDPGGAGFAASRRRCSSRLPGRSPTPALPPLVRLSPPLKLPVLSRSSSLSPPEPPIFP